MAPKQSSSGPEAEVAERWGKVPERKGQGGGVELMKLFRPVKKPVRAPSPKKGVSEPGDRNVDRKLSPKKGHRPQASQSEPKKGHRPQASQSEPRTVSLEKEVEGGASRTLLLHGLETDWIEEEMADDDDFRQVRRLGGTG